MLIYLSITLFLVLATSGFLLLRYMVVNGVTVIQRSEYEVEIQESQGMKGLLYDFLSGPNAYLLVLTNEMDGTTEGYYLDIENNAIGIPDFSKYKPIGKFGFVDETTKNGAPTAGTLDCDIEIGDDLIKLFIKGWSSEAKEISGDTSFLKSRIGYRKTILLKKK